MKLCHVEAVENQRESKPFYRLISHFFYFYALKTLANENSLFSKVRKARFSIPF